MENVELVVPTTNPMYDFRKELEHLINSRSMENGSHTPDFILADYLTDCLKAFDRAVTNRSKWYGQTPPDKIELKAE